MFDIKGPWDEKMSIHRDWVQIHRPVWSNTELLKRVHATTQLLNNSRGFQLPAMLPCTWLILSIFLEELEQFHKGMAERGEPEDI